MRFWVAFVGEHKLSELQRAMLPGKREGGAAALQLMNEHLADRVFFVGERLSLADVALYAYTHVAGEGGFDLGVYPAVEQWLDRVAGEPGYIAMDA